MQSCEQILNLIDLIYPFLKKDFLTDKINFLILYVILQPETMRILFFGALRSSSFIAFSFVIGKKCLQKRPDPIYKEVYMAFFYL